MPRLFTSRWVAIRVATVSCAAALAAGCAPADSPDADPATAESATTAFTGMTLWDGTGQAPVPDAVLLVRDGRVQAAGPAHRVQPPAGAREVSLAGTFVTPGLINVHGHVGGLTADEPDPVAAVRRELARYARFGVTTVNSQGGEPHGLQPLRHAARGATETTPAPESALSEGEGPHARLFMAGSVVAGRTADAVRTEVDRNAERGVDWIKIRVDDNLGTTPKMGPEVYTAAIEQAHGHGLPLEAHLFYLDDAKGLLDAGADLIAHSIRDQPVDQAVTEALVSSGVCYVPTLAREVSAFAYGETPDFLADPFLVGDVDSSQVEVVLDPARQAVIRNSDAARAYRDALSMAQANLDALAEAGVTIAFGTDSGPLGRFQGFFEHMEMELMAEAGLTPEQILLSATRDAARCIDRGDLGTLEAGRWADFLVFEQAPWDDVSHSRTLQSAWIGGVAVPRP